MESRTANSSQSKVSNEIKTEVAKPQESSITSSTNCDKYVLALAKSNVVPKEKCSSHKQVLG